MGTEMVRVEFALGEVTSLGMLIAMGIIPTPEIDAHGITGKEQWNAQGLEGKAFVEVNPAIAQVIVSKLTRLRSRII